MMCLPGTSFLTPLLGGAGSTLLGSDVLGTLLSTLTAPFTSFLGANKFPLPQVLNSTVLILLHCSVMCLDSKLGDPATFVNSLLLIWCGRQLLLHT